MLGAREAADPPDLLDRQGDPIGPREDEVEVVPLEGRSGQGVAAAVGASPHRAPDDAVVARDAVVDVDDDVARRQALEDVTRDDAAQRSRAADAHGPE